jgi:hypothetical protein
MRQFNFSELSLPILQGIVELHIPPLLVVTAGMAN